MEATLANLGFSEGIIETIKWWLPYLGFIVAVIAVVVIVMMVRKKKK